MLDVGWQELFIIGVITIVVVGPEEIPKVLRTVTSWVRRIREMAREFQSGIDDIARESELADIKRDLEATANVDMDETLENIMDPGGEISSDLYDLQKASEDLALQQEEIAARQVEIDSQRDALEREESAEFTPPNEHEEAKSEPDMTTDSSSGAVETDQPATTRS
jgi:sec-independent protein translocase protein TatB